MNPHILQYFTMYATRQSTKSSQDQLKKKVNRENEENALGSSHLNLDTVHLWKLGR